MWKYRLLVEERYKAKSERERGFTEAILVNLFWWTTLSDGGAFLAAQSGPRRARSGKLACIGQADACSSIFRRHSENILLCTENIIWHRPIPSLAYSIGVQLSQIQMYWQMFTLPFSCCYHLVWDNFLNQNVKYFRWYDDYTTYFVLFFLFWNLYDAYWEYLKKESKSNKWD